MITAEIWSWESGIRCTDKKEYKRLCDLEKELMLSKIAGTWVGHKIYNCSMKQFDAMSQLQKSQSVSGQQFDKAAYRGVTK
tara:strand:+ start:899 stop:1141 length:243 start_codon:yes stop_codon:yes gene_type:complete